MRKTVSSFGGAVLVAAALALPAFAQQHAMHHDTETVASDPATLWQGQVQRIDKETGKVAIRHGGAGMPVMTMVYPVKEAALLDKINVGDAVRFATESLAGRVTVTRLDPVR